MTATPSNSYANTGGFLPPSLPSPAPSTASSRAAAGLPHPRSKPLVPGSRKEDYARDYVYRRLLHISRRYVKKHSIPDPNDQVSAYGTFDEVCMDLEEVVDVLWFSGTPSLQVPYLLNVALAITEYLPAFPPAPRPTFALLKKLDHCFSSLLQGRDIRSGETLPGFELGMSKGMTRTDMVRIRSLADETRGLVALKMSGEVEVDTSLFPEDSEVGVPILSGRKRKANAEENDNEHDVNDDVDDAPSTSSASSSLSLKRQKTKSPARVKVESPALKLENSSPSPRANEIAQAADAHTSSNSGQFHWAVEEEDSDDEQDRATDQAADEAGNVQPQQMTPPTISEPDSQQPVLTNHLNDYVLDDEEDHELHMSVAKVYEKTIIQLGRTLGETLVDD
ncbi:hypothetical protein BKA67DRAFT_539170 [Truncatella angustata]|uniref:Meiotic recombination protein DMC1 n=1 Tax=Truncatella angustata TaxID=152316 RepID=A0A9P8ZVY2_9PEZI|nr:uncharacterized protein BKA67DRAFT_539170 [Truncatella angustata]KAH6649179.1 hypothetical protein BKA67DRAFT_539170 [Truncatella angustata]